MEKATVKKIRGNIFNNEVGQVEKGGEAETERRS